MQDNLRTVNVGLIGLGTVGGGVARTILSHHDRYLDAYNIDLKIARACGLVWEQAGAAGITPEAMQLEVKKAYRKSRAIEKRKREAQELDIARQRAPKTRAIHYDNLRSATAEEGLICMLLREPELIAGVKLPAEACSVDLFGRVLTQLRQRVQSGRPVSLAAMEGEFTPEEMSHLSYILSKDTSPVSDEALADYLRVIQEEYEGRTRARSEDSLRLLAEQMKSTKQYGG